MSANDDCTSDFIVWPLRVGETLSNHDWWPFYGHKFLGSKFLSTALMEKQREVIGTALILWSEAMRQDPGGTLPSSDIELASLARYSSLDDWCVVKGRVMHGWVTVHVEDMVTGRMEERLGHPGLIQGIVEEMYKRKRGRDGAREAAKLAVKKSRIKAKLAEMKVGEAIISNPQAITALAEYFEHSDLYITSDNVKAAMVEVLGYSGEIAKFPRSGGR
ncbi:hypothetical protein [Roseobacter sp. TSBP12]|uniref:hypothetical protein n=1 Tax=Roseobacter sp. TSBP12 TaxID=1236613 RepID=UPI00125EF8BD|nr:hypothetical protein [Roseobacter sp. TSBP12]KAB6714316.1 hypothetical protein C8029_21490 [Roseobacter sp. TSBP12]